MEIISVLALRAANLAALHKPEYRGGAWEAPPMASRVKKEVFNLLIRIVMKVRYALQMKMLDLTKWSCSCTLNKSYEMTMCKEEEEILSKLDWLIDAAIGMGGEAALKALGEKLNTRV